MVQGDVRHPACRRVLLICLPVFLWGTLWTGCSSGSRLKSITPQDQFAAAKAVFDREDYFKAKNLFTVLVLNSPAGGTFERAQFYLAESEYGLKEFIEAIAEYEKLIKSMPGSEFVDDARYKIGMCYYKLAPGYALDQDYTFKAISQFQQFLDDHPDSEWRPEVERRLTDCRNKLAKKEFKTGELYIKMRYERAALISFDAVLELYRDSDFADDALFWKGETHRRLGEIEAADLAFRSLLVSYPQSPFVSKASSRLKDMPRDRSASGGPSGQ
jgi:outer membrane protein assembly factor BamD